jgi:hypothetical protein
MNDDAAEDGYVIISTGVPKSTTRRIVEAQRAG